MSTNPNLEVAYSAGMIPVVNVCMKEHPKDDKIKSMGFMITSAACYSKPFNKSSGNRIALSYGDDE